MVDEEIYRRLPTLLIATRPSKVGRGMAVTPLELDEPRVVDLLCQEGFLHYNNAAMLLCLHILCLGFFQFVELPLRRRVRGYRGRTWLATR